MWKEKGPRFPVLPFDLAIVPCHAPGPDPTDASPTNSELALWSTFQHPDEVSTGRGIWAVLWSRSLPGSRSHRWPRLFPPRSYLRGREFWNVHGSAAPRQAFSPLRKSWKWASGQADRRTGGQACPNSPPAREPAFQVSEEPRVCGFHNKEGFVC